MVNSIFLAILVMAGVTYLIRVTPLVLIRREIKNPVIRSFLHYVPYVTLSVMTFLFGADRYGTFLTFLPFIGNTLLRFPLLARRHLTRAYGRLTSCRER